MSLDTIKRVENACGMGFMGIAQSLQTGNITTEKMESILYLAIRAGGSDVNQTDISILTDKIGYIETVKITGELLALALDVQLDNTEKKTTI
jgi:hypothetical protein